jgi:hypothetical protein
MPDGSDGDKFNEENAKQLYDLIDSIHKGTKSSLENLINWSFAISTASLVWVASNVEKLPYVPCTKCVLAWYSDLFLWAIIFLALSTIGLGLLRAKIYYDQYLLDHDYEFILISNLCIAGRPTSIRQIMCSDYIQYRLKRDASYRSYKKFLLIYVLLYLLGVLSIGLNIFYMLKA